MIPLPVTPRIGNEIPDILRFWDHVDGVGIMTAEKIEELSGQPLASVRFKLREAVACGWLQSDVRPWGERWWLTHAGKKRWSEGAPA